MNRPRSSGPTGINNRGQVVFNGKKPDTDQMKTWVYGPATSNGPKLVQPPNASQNSTYGYAINDDGRVVGSLFSGDYLVGEPQAFRWDFGATMTELPKLFSSETDYQVALGCSATKIVGKSKDVNAGVAAFQWLSNTNAISALAIPSTQSGCARDVNSSGACVGDHSTNGQQACWWSADGTRTDIPLPSGYDTNSAVALNDSNVVVGWAQKAAPDNSQIGFKWVQATNTLTTFNFATFGLPVDINSGGDILFDAADPKILLSDGTTVWNLETMESGSPNWTMGTAIAMNDRRMVTLTGKDESLSIPTDRSLLAAPVWATTKSIPISVSLLSWANSDTPITIKFSLRYGDADVEVVQDTYTFNGSTAHEFSVPTKLRGDVTINVSVAPSEDHKHWLRKSITVDVPVSGAAESGSVALVNGDVNSTNYVNTDDYLILSDAFDSTPSDPNWDIRADLNGDGIINTDDYQILSDNFDVAGDE